MALRQEVFIVEQECPYLDADNKDQACWHLMGFGEDNKLEAYARLLPKGIIYQDAVSIGRITTSPDRRGKGGGKELLEMSLKWIEELFGKGLIRIGAQSYLVEFYRRFGFISTGKEYLEDDIPHTEMVLNP